MLTALPAACLCSALARSQSWQRMPKRIELAAACGCIAGAASGFLFHNFPPAKVFLGRRWVSAVGVPRRNLRHRGLGARCLATSGSRLLVFSPFLIDATVTLVRRGATPDANLARTSRTPISAHGDTDGLGSRAHSRRLVWTDGAGRSIGNRRRKVAQSLANRASSRVGRALRCALHSGESTDGFWQK